MSLGWGIVFASLSLLACTGLPEPCYCHWVQMKSSCLMRSAVSCSRFAMLKSIRFSGIFLIISDIYLISISHLYIYISSPYQVTSISKGHLPDGTYLLDDPPCNVSAALSYAPLMCCSLLATLGLAIAQAAGDGLLLQIAKGETEERRGETQAMLLMVLCHGGLGVWGLELLEAVKMVKNNLFFWSMSFFTCEIYPIWHREVWFMFLLTGPCQVIMASTQVLGISLLLEKAMSPNSHWLINREHVEGSHPWLAMYPPKSPQRKAHSGTVKY